VLEDSKAVESSMKLNDYDSKLEIEILSSDGPIIMESIGASNHLSNTAGHSSKLVSPKDTLLNTTPFVTVAINDKVQPQPPLSNSSLVKVHLSSTLKSIKPESFVQPESQAHETKETTD